MEPTNAPRAQCQFYAPALEVLRRIYGHQAFRKGQFEVIESVLQKRDTVLISSTGSGKSATFVIPAVVANRTTVVISPFISLQVDQVMNLRAQGITAVALNSVNTEPDAWSDAINGRATVVFMSPELLNVKLDMLGEMIARGLISHLSVDEAHLISQQGHSFREEYRRVSAFRRRFPQIPIIAVTATATPVVEKDMIQQLELRNPNVFKTGFDRPNLSYDVIEVVGYKKTELEAAMRKYLTRDLIRDGECCLLYVSKKADAEAIAALYTGLGLRAAFYHAGMTPSERKKVHEGFMQDKYDIVAATSAFGTGVDRADVRLVMFWGIQTSISEIVQMAGRAGRDGLPARTILFWHKQHVNIAAFFVRQDKNPQGQAMLDELKGYLYQQTCRRETLLKHFAETSERMAVYIDPVTKKFNCKNCDVCKGTVTARSAETTTRDRSRTATSGSPDAPPALKTSLKSWRDAEATRQNKPRYMILGDATLDQIAVQRPRESFDLRQIGGIGDIKLSLYGDAILSIVAEWCIANPGFATRTNNAHIPSGDTAIVVRKRPAAVIDTKVPVTALHSLQMNVAGKTCAQIADTRKITIGTVLDHLIACAEQGLAGVRMHELPITADIDAYVSTGLQINPDSTLSSLAGYLTQIRPDGNLSSDDWVAIKASRLRYMLQTGRWGVPSCNKR